MMRVLWGCQPSWNVRVHLLILSLSPIPWLPYYSHCITLLYFEFINNKEACLLLKNIRVRWKCITCQSHTMVLGKPCACMIFLFLLSVSVSVSVCLSLSHALYMYFNEGKKNSAYFLASEWMFKWSEMTIVGFLPWPG